MLHALSLALALAAGTAPKPAVEFQATFLYSVSTPFGVLPLSDVGLSFDSGHGELYVTGDGPVRVFNESGMEVYSFGDSPEVSIVRSIAATEDGTLLALAQRRDRVALVRCNFRGEFLGDFVPRNVPEPFASMHTTVMRYRNRKVYLADLPGMRFVVLDDTGEFLASYDVAEKIGEAAKREDLGVRGFSVDGEGNLLFTIQPLFRAYSMTPDGTIRAFGVRGSAPGKFNVVGGITRDDAGYYYVVDVLKSCVIVFDPAFEFVKEFGYRGWKPGSLAAPEDVVAGGGKLFISNRGRKGVAVYRVGLVDPSTVQPEAETVPIPQTPRRRGAGSRSNPQ